MAKKIKRALWALVAVVWVMLTLFAWFAQPKQMSESERRVLAQMPQFSLKNVTSGKFMSEFEKYSLDQFPARDTFRQIKSLFHTYALNQSDNHNIYIADGYAAEMLYPLNEKSLNRALTQFNKIYTRYLQGNANIYSCVIPDKSYYLAQENGYLTMDYDALFAQVQFQMPWAEYIDITALLSAQDYYYTDTHWRQERLLPVAQKLCQVMGVQSPNADDYTKTSLKRLFYGVYYGQAALPMKPETMYLMQSDLLEDCRVYQYTDNRYSQVYDAQKYESKDLYDVFLSGAQSLLRIENPNAEQERKLIIFRDSFASSLAPLLAQGYSEIILADIRYISVEVLGNYIDFENADVLFLYSSLVLNKNLI